MALEMRVTMIGRTRSSPLPFADLVIRRIQEWGEELEMMVRNGLRGQELAKTGITPG